jgi:hypothetical protein
MTNVYSKFDRPTSCFETVNNKVFSIIDLWHKWPDSGLSQIVLQVRLENIPVAHQLVGSCGLGTSRTLRAAVKQQLRDLCDRTVFITAKFH